MTATGVPQFLVALFHGLRIAENLMARHIAQIRMVGHGLVGAGMAQAPFVTTKRAMLVIFEGSHAWHVIAGSNRLQERREGLLENRV
jgi:hypothetical protein